MRVFSVLQIVAHQSSPSQLQNLEISTRTPTVEFYFTELQENVSYEEEEKKP